MSRDSRADRHDAVRIMNSVSRRLDRGSPHTRWRSRCGPLGTPSVWWLPVALAGLTSMSVAAVLSFPLHFPTLVPQFERVWTLVRILIEI